MLSSHAWLAADTALALIAGRYNVPPDRAAAVRPVPSKPSSTINAANVAPNHCERRHGDSVAAWGALTIRLRQRDEVLGRCISMLIECASVSVIMCDKPHNKLEVATEVSRKGSKNVEVELEWLRVSVHIGAMA